MKYNKIWIDKYTLPLEFIVHDTNGAVVCWTVQQVSSDQTAQTT